MRAAWKRNARPLTPGSTDVMEKAVSATGTYSLGGVQKSEMMREAPSSSAYI